ncbi:VOC family protein [Nonomuraea africana]|uniref:VOC family protein n=1 Tax=Nonomuraea africana TaxID=46171 RepID=UPI0033F00523
MVNTVSWFEVATDDPEGVQRFYGDLFGWHFAEAQGVSMDYRFITETEGAKPTGGILGTEGRRPGHAVFFVHVDDVETACVRAEALGGKMLSKVIDDTGGASFAYLHDISGNLFGVHTPPAG